MQKVLLVSILIAHLALPIWAARDRNARRGLKKVLFAVAVFDAFYVLALVFIFPHL